MLQTNKDYAFWYEVYETRQSLQTLMPDWRGLIARSGFRQTPFQTPEWCLAWLDVNPDTQPVFVTIWQDGKLIFLAPFMRVKSLPGVRTLGFFSQPDCKYGGVIWDADRDGETLFKDCVAYLQDETNCDLLLLNDIAQDEPWITGYSDYISDSELNYSSILRINDEIRQDPIQSLHKIFRRDVRRSIRRLEESGNITVEMVECDETWLNDILPTLMEWKMQWLQNRGRWGGGIFDNSFRQFVSRLFSTRQSGSLRAQSCIIRLDGKLLTADIHFIQQGTVFGFFSSFDPAVKRVSLGTLSDYYVIEWLLDNHCHSFDLLGYPEPYKERLANCQLKLVNLHLPLSYKGRIAKIAGRIKFRKIAKILFYTLPATWRRLLIDVLRKQKMG